MGILIWRCLSQTHDFMSICNVFTDGKLLAHLDT